MDRLTVPDERVDGGLRRAIIDAREVRGHWPCPGRDYGG